MVVPEQRRRVRRLLKIEHEGKYQRSLDDQVGEREGERERERERVRVRAGLLRQPGALVACSCSIDRGIDPLCRRLLNVSSACRCTSVVRAAQRQTARLSMHECTLFAHLVLNGGKLFSPPPSLDARRCHADFCCWVVQVREMPVNVRTMVHRLQAE